MTMQSRTMKSAQRLRDSQLVRFILVGGVSAIVDLGTTVILKFVFGQSNEVAKAVGFVLGTLTAYFINRRWTFKATASTKRFVTTMVTYLITFVVQTRLFHWSIPWFEKLDVNEFWVTVFAFVLAQGVATIINFLIQKFLIFRS